MFGTTDIDYDDDYAEKKSIRIVPSSELTGLMEQQDVLLNF